MNDDQLALQRTSTAAMTYYGHAPSGQFDFRAAKPLEASPCSRLKPPSHSLLDAADKNVTGTAACAICI